MTLPTATPHEEIETWIERLRRREIAYDKAASAASVGAQIIGAVTTVITAVVGTAIFTSINASPALWAKIAAGTLSVAAAVLLAIQSSLNLVDRAKRCHATSARAGSLARDLELLRDESLNGSVTAKALSEVKNRMEDLQTEAPNIAQRYWDQAMTQQTKPEWRDDRAT